MNHPYFPQGDQDLREMMEIVGVSSLEDLFRTIPESIRLKSLLNVPRALPEQRLVAHLDDLSQRNCLGEASKRFLGGGAYSHYIPSIIDTVLLRAEFYTSYTPYQPEISQGGLQALFEFQTMIAGLTGMDVANASLYDGATALVEAVMMAGRVIKKKKTVLVSRTMHPQYRQVLTTYLQNMDLVVKEIPFQGSGSVDLAALAGMVDEDVFAIAVQTPNYLGVIENLKEIQNLLGDRKIFKIAVTSETLSLALLEPPGHFGFDVACGEAQSFGIPLSYGGPYLGFFATRQEYLRQLPGRICGETRDSEGKRGFVLTLSTREQHIRREKATSNICTNHALCALAATVYLELYGRKGLRQLAEVNTIRAHHLRSRLEGIDGISFPLAGPIFNECVIGLPDGKHEELQKRGYTIGPALGDDYPEFKDHYLMAVTEMNEPESLSELVDAARSLS